MIKAYKFVIAVIIMALGLGIGYAGIKVFKSHVIADEQLNMDHDPETLKERVDMDIKPCNDIPRITKEQALDIATKHRGSTDGVKKIHAQYCSLTTGVVVLHPEDKPVKENPALKGKDNIESLPIWIVSFRGLDGHKHVHPYTEVNYVVDATSGVVIYSFTYR
jgi:hypothetical protein